jgi:prepilin-type N-terminal cleavage/methylation domain-containing protein
MTCKHSTSRGFTLLEILLVVLVIGIAAAAFFPAALNTVDNARTRSALRETISINRYARSLAILERRPMAMLYLKDGGELQLVSLPPHQTLQPDDFLQGSASSFQSTDLRESMQAITPVRSKTLPDFIRIRNVEGAQREADMFYVIYDANGTTDAHVVELVDLRGGSHRIRVNGITGEIDFVD